MREALFMGIMRTKSVEQSMRDTEEPEFQLRKALGPLDLTVFGIGVIIGTGIFVLTGVAAANFGPGLPSQAHQEAEYAELPLLEECFAHLARFFGHN